MAFAGDDMMFALDAHKSCLFKGMAVSLVSGLISLALVLSTVVAQPAYAAKLEGQRFDDTVELAGKTLQLNGLGLRGVAWIKAFVAGLYLPSRSPDATQVLEMAGPKRLRLKIMLEAPSKELSKAVRRGVEKNESGKALAALTGRVSQFNQAMDSIGTLRVGDSLELDFIPGKGTVLRWNDKTVGPTIQGDDFYRAVLKIFIGDRPVDARMKEGMLRGQ